MNSNKISFYYQDFGDKVHNNDNIEELIQLHTRSFEAQGWEVILVDESIAKLHPKYSLFDDPSTILGRSKNNWFYTRACYMRWLAYAVLGYSFADLDVINYGFTPKDAKNIRSNLSTSSPVFLSLAGAVGLIAPDGYDLLIDTYVRFIETADPDNIPVGIMSHDINDMSIMRHFHPDWYEFIEYNDDRYAKDYSLYKWEHAKLVHYPFHFTPQPRIETIRKERNIFV